MSDNNNNSLETGTCTTINTNLAEFNEALGFKYLVVDVERLVGRTNTMQYQWPYD